METINIDYSNAPKGFSEKHIEELKMMPSHERARIFHDQFINFPLGHKLLNKQMKLFYEGSESDFPISDSFQMYPRVSVTKNITNHGASGDFWITRATVVEDGYSKGTQTIFQQMHGTSLKDYQKDNPFHNLEFEAREAASSVKQSFPIADTRNDITDFFLRYAYQYRITEGYEADKETILNNLVRSQYYVVPSPNIDNTHIYIPKSFISQFESLTQDDINYGINQLFLFATNEKFQNSIELQMGLDEGSNREVHLKGSQDGAGLAFYISKAGAAHQYAEIPGTTISWEEVSKFSKYRVELAALEDIMFSQFPDRLPGMADIDPKYKYNVILEAVKDYESSLDDDGNFKKRMYLNRNLQGLLRGSGLLGYYEAPYDFPFVPEWAEETERHISNMPGRMYRNVNSFWNGFVTKNAEIGHLEYNVFKEFLKRVGSNPSVKKVNSTFKEMVEERSRREADLLDNLVDWAIGHGEWTFDSIDTIHSNLIRKGLLSE